MSRVTSFPPIVAPDAKVLILGSMPGVASLRAQQYYAHPRNAFWPIVTELFDTGPLDTYGKRRTAILENQLALWDVLQSCVRPGSLDSEIRTDTETPNDFPGLFRASPGIAHVFFNGGKAEKSFNKHVLPTLDTPPATTRLPSTSPAMAALNFDQKLDAWQPVKDTIRNA